MHEHEKTILNTIINREHIALKRGKAMNTFYFNTGVTPSSVMYGNQVWRGGVKQIPFECEAPETARFKFACDYDDLPESKLDNWLVAEIVPVKGGMISKYAYFYLAC